MWSGKRFSPDGAALLRRAIAVLHESRGSVVVEWALTAPVLLAFFFATVEIGVMTLADLSLQKGVEAAARGIRTGDIRSSSDLEKFKSKACTDVSSMVDCENALINIQTFGSVGSGSYSGFSSVTYPMPVYDQYGNVTNYSFYPTGSSAEKQITTVQMQAKYKSVIPGLGFFFGGNAGAAVFSHAMVLVTEPFGS
jgi:Flp pilus assembly protein TadG